MGKITLINIAEELASRSSLDKATADNFIHAFIETIEKGLYEDNLVKIKGLGTFKLMEVSDRGSIDVNTGERITIKGHTKVSFTPDSAMKEFVNKPFAHFEPTELNDAYAEEEILDTPSEQIRKDNETLESDVDIVAEDNSEDIVACSDAQSEDNAANVAASESVEVESQAVELQEAGEDVVAESIVNIPADTPSAEENRMEETIETAMDAPMSEECTEHGEESAESVEATAEIEENTVAETGVVTEEQLTSLAGQKERSRWSLIVLLVVLAGGIYYYLSDDKSVASNNGEVVGEIGHIMVNPNLEQELGAEWGDEDIEQSAESAAPVDVNDTVKEEEGKTPVNVVAESQPAEEQTVQPSPEVKAPAALPTVPKGANFLTITESLAAKNLKDITIADTTEYLIAGTQSTHTLQSGETIIQLARKYYGDKRLWPYIVKHNHITDFNKVKVGMAIDIPVLMAK